MAKENFGVLGGAMGDAEPGEISLRGLLGRSLKGKIGFAVGGTDAKASENVRRGSQSNFLSCGGRRFSEINGGHPLLEIVVP